MAEEDLKGNVAIVPGGSLGIGRATCVALARAGAQVAAAYFQAQHLQNTQLSGVQCGLFHERPGCQVHAWVSTPGFLLPKKWITVNAIGYLAHGVTREDQ